MKHAFLAVPVLAFCAAGALAQTETGAGATAGAAAETATGVTTGTATEATTDTGVSAGATAGADASVETFGTNWPLSVGTTFFTDADSGTLRTSEDIAGGWQSLSQEDRDMIKADCATFMAAHGEAGAGASTEASGAAATGAASTETATTEGSGAASTTGTAAASDGASASGGTEGTIAAVVGYDLSEMKLICEAVEKL